MKVWNKGGGIQIWPHIEFPEVWSFNKIRDVIYDIQNNLFLNTYIFEDGYCSEMDGKWNMVFAIVKYKDDVKYKYTYVIRRDKLAGHTYACPIEKDDYGDIKEFALTKNEPEFLELEQYLVAMYNGRLITGFPS
jgi:hypothetical protein